MVLMKKINLKDISVVVQGSIDKKRTPICLKSIRKHLPNAEIVLSTWKNTDVSKLDYDKLILNDDPGSDGFNAFCLKGGTPCNITRQIISTVNGIKECSGKYILKIRSDFYLTSAKFLEYFDTFNQRNEYTLFSHRVIVPSVLSRRFSNQTGYPLPFHVSDFFFFGRAEDIKNYFINTPLPDKNDACNYKLKYPHKLPYKDFTWRYAPEQYFCVNFLKRNDIQTNFSDWTDWSSENLELSDNYLFANFIFLDYNQIGLDSKKHHSNLRLVHSKKYYGLITFSYFLKEYNRRFNEKLDFNKLYCYPISYYIKKILKIVLMPLRLPLRFLKKIYKIFKIFIRWC